MALIVILVFILTVIAGGEWVGDVLYTFVKSNGQIVIQGRVNINYRK